MNQDSAVSSASQESANSGPTPTPEEEQEISLVQGIGQAVSDQAQISIMSSYDEIVQRRVRRLCGLISKGDNKLYAETMTYVRCRLAFALLRSAIMCVRGAHSSQMPCGTWQSLRAGYEGR